MPNTSPTKVKNLFKFENLVFRGGGMCGIAYIGFLRQAHKLGLIDLNNIKRVGGASVGSLAALFLGLGYTPKEAEEVLRTIDFPSLRDASYATATYHFLHDGGMYPGVKLHELIQSVIKTKTDLENPTFEELAEWKKERGLPDDYYVATRYSKRFNRNTDKYESWDEEVIFSLEHTPKVRIADAVHASCAVQLYFMPVLMDHDFKRTDDGFQFADGGVECNFPVRMFDYQRYIDNVPTPHACHGRHERTVRNPKTLGIGIVRDSEIEQYSPPDDDLIEKPIDKTFDYLSAVIVSLVSGSQATSFNHSNDIDRSVLISNRGKGFLDFFLKRDDFDELESAGCDAANKFFIDRLSPPDEKQVRVKIDPAHEENREERPFVPTLMTPLMIGQAYFGSYRRTEKRTLTTTVEEVHETTETEIEATVDDFVMVESPKP